MFQTCNRHYNRTLFNKFDLFRLTVYSFGVDHKNTILDGFLVKEAFLQIYLKLIVTKICNYPNILYRVFRGLTENNVHILDVKVSKIVLKMPSTLWNKTTLKKTRDAARIFVEISIQEKSLISTNHKGGY